MALGVYRYCPSHEQNIEDYHNYLLRMLIQPECFNLTNSMQTMATQTMYMENGPLLGRTEQV